MNDWPADPKLDVQLRRLADAELAAARTDATGLSLRPERNRTQGARALAGLGTLAVIAVVASLALRGTGGSQAGGPGKSKAPEASETVAIASASPVESASPSAPTPAALEGSSGTFSPTGKMASSDNGMATPLLDGRVLIVGNGATSPELFDPKTGTFSRTGAAAIDSNFATATRLLDGRVLFVGGNNDKTTFATAQLYDPATGKFSPTGSLITGRMGNTATLLPDGRVLIAGGSTFNFALAMAYNPGAAGSSAIQKTMTGPDMLASAELYNPKTGKFSPTGSMTTGRDAASATLLADGRVLIVGAGNEGSAPVATAEIYDPKTGKFSATGSMPIAGYGYTSVRLHDGRVLISGGTDGNNPLDSLEIFDPKTSKFSSAGSFDHRAGPSTVVLADGRVLFAGGYDISALKAGGYLATCELFDPVTGKLSPTGSMATGRQGGSATLLPAGRVLVAGGVGSGEPGNLDSAELYQP